MVIVMGQGLYIVRLIITRLKVTPGASTEVLSVYDPPKVTVPELALKVGVPLFVKLCEIVITPVVEVNVPPESTKFPVTSMATVPPVNVPSACIKPLAPIVILTAAD
jgi:hypothetical protein